MKYGKVIISLMFFTCTGCTASTSAITSSESQLMTRQIQTHEYEQISQKQAMKASIATLQDLSFILDKVDACLGTISASKFRNGENVKATVIVREKTPMSVSVRVNVTYGTITVEDPLIYQDFFTQLDKSLFLINNQVD